LLLAFLILYSLRGDSRLLSLVREQLFKLWGDLEELKSEGLRQQSKRGKELPPSSLGSEFPASSPPRKAGEMPDADSDVENEPLQPKLEKNNSKSAVLTERDPNISKSGIVAGSADKSAPSLEVKNKAFTCCVRQYGVKVDEDDPSKANAGDGKRWQRVFGLFGTHIV
jgi:protection-of-telomeres protein 1